MADTDIGNEALILVGETSSVPLDALSDRPNDLAIVYTPQLKAVLSRGPWNFATKRTRLTAAGFMDNSSRVVTITGNDRPTADTVVIDTGSFLTAGFLAGDLIGISGAGANDGSHEIASAAALTLTSEIHTELTSQVLTNDTDLKLYAQPGHKWRYKYEQPSDAVKIWAIDEHSMEAQPDWSKNGKYIVTNRINTNDQINVTYIQLVTDTDLMSDLFKEIFAIKLASVLALVIKEDIDLKKELQKHYDFKVKQAFAEEASEGNEDEANFEHRSLGPWESAGRGGFPDGTGRGHHGHGH